MPQPYKFRQNAPGVIRVEDGVVIMPDAGGYNWQSYLSWMLAGNEADPADTVVVVRNPLPKIEIVRRLSDFELEALETARQTRPLRERLLWESAQDVNPEDPMLVAFFTAVIGELRTAEILSEDGNPP